MVPVPEILLSRAVNSQTGLTAQYKEQAKCETNINKLMPDWDRQARSQGDGVAGRDV